MDDILHGPLFRLRRDRSLLLVGHSRERRMKSGFSSRFLLRTTGAACIMACLIVAASPAKAAALPPGASGMDVPFTLLTILQEWDLSYARAAARGPRGGAVARGPRGAVARGPRGGVAARGAYGGAVARGPAGNVAVRPGYRPPVPAGGWYRPPSYWWRPGAAVAAGAALGFVTAAAATAYATSPAPAAGYCWYYTNPQRTQGFWDVCPR